VNHENLAQCVEYAFSRYSENTLFSYNNTDMSYAEAVAHVRGRAHWLAQQGFGSGDVIALLSGNSPEWCLTFLAIVSAGCIVLPLDTGLPPEKYDFMIAFAQAKAVFVSDAFAGIPTNVRRVPVALESPADHPPVETPSVTKKSPAAYLFTSGTTGDPKVVTLTHGNILHIAIVCTQLEQYTEKDVTLSILPLFHVYALESVFMAPFVTGSRIVLQPSLKGPDIVKSLADHPITIFPAAPQMWTMFFDSITAKLKAQSMFKYRFFMFLLNNAPLLRALGMGLLLKKVFSPIHNVLGRSHRFFISGGAPLKKEYFNYYRRMGFRIMEGYGLTETTGPIAIPYYKKSEAGSVGAPIPGNEVIIKNAGSDGIGEVWLRGEAVMAGYYRNDEANRNAFDSDGFFNSGDLGRVDKKGSIWLTGRFKNVIVLESGKNVYPEEVEQFYLSSPAIEEISVFGSSVDGVETVCAVIVPVLKSSLSYTVVQGQLRALEKGISSYKIIRRFALSFEPLPKNSTRKVIPAKVKELWNSGTLVTGGEQAVAKKEIFATTPREESALDLLKRFTKRDTLYFDDTFADLGIDSLGLIDLVVRCEEELHLTVDLARVSAVKDLYYILSTQDPAAGGRVEDRIFSGPVTTSMPWFFNPFHHLSLWLMRFLSVLFWRVRIVNRSALDVHNCIIAANHQSYLDAVWISSAIPVRRRKEFYFIGKKRLSFLKWCVPMLPVIFVEERNTLPSLKASADILRSGKTLVIFPEGTRTRSGEIGEFKTGAAYLAFHLGRPIVPVSVTGAFEIYPESHSFPRFFTKVRGTVIAGDPLDPASFESVEALNDALRKVIAGNMNRERAVL
jgi:long-chain acyl-CoA synthetase